MPGDEARPPSSPDSALKRRFLQVAWQPLTPRGVAAFACAPVRRLWQIQLIAAFLAAGAVVWFLLVAWFPVIRQAIRQLPDTGEIRQQQLILPAMPDGALAQNRYLTIVLDQQGRNAADTVADLRVRIQARGLELGSLFGRLDLAYPRGYAIQFNRPEVQPWWDAWEPFLLLSVALAAIALLLVLWGVLAALYCPVVLLVARVGLRDLTLVGSWKLASAALIPGALVQTLGLVLYGAEVLDLIHLAVVAALHFALGWLYGIAGALVLPRMPPGGRPAPNPFTGRVDCGQRDA